MRNLKKVLSLALAMVMLLGMMVVGAGATSFKDADKIDNDYQIAAAILEKIGVMEGDSDGNFMPKKELNRVEGAAIIYRIVMGGIVKNPVGVSGFADVDDVPNYSWASGTIAACRDLGIIDGVSDTSFAPGEKLTAAAYAKMLLVALGYESEKQGYTGDGWIASVSRDARTRGILLEAMAMTENLTREQAAEMALKTLVADTMEYAGLNFSGEGFSATSPATVRKYDSVNGTDGNRNNKTYNNVDITPATTPIKLCEEKFPALKLDSTEDESFGRAQTVWTWKNVPIDNTVTNVEANATFTAADDEKAVRAKIGRASNEVVENGRTTYDCNIYINGSHYTSASADDGYRTLIDAKFIADTWTDNGRTVEVYLNTRDNSKIDKIVVVDTALGEVTRVDSKDEKITIRLEASNATDGKPVVLPATKEGYGDFEKGDLVLVQGYFNPSKSADRNIFLNNKTTVSSVTAPTKIVDIATALKYSNNVKTTLVIDGGEYSDAWSVNPERSVAKFELDKTLESTVYLDQYNYVVKAIPGSDPNVTTDNLIAVKRTFLKVDKDGVASPAVTGVRSNGETVTWTLKDSITFNANHSIFKYEANNDGTYTLISLDEDQLSKPADGAKKNTYVADCYQTLESVERIPVNFTATDKRGHVKLSAEGLYYAGDVKFIFADGSDVTVLDGQQKYDYKHENIIKHNADDSVIAHALRWNGKRWEISAVFIEAKAETEPTGDIIYVANYLNRWERRTDDDGNVYFAYEYEAYTEDGELIEDFAGDLGEEHVTTPCFIRAKTDDHGLYDMDYGTDKLGGSTKVKQGVVMGNSFSSNIFTTKGDFQDYIAASDVVVIDLTNNGIESIADLNAAANNYANVEVAIIHNNKNVATTVYVTSFNHSATSKGQMSMSKIKELPDGVYVFSEAPKDAATNVSNLYTTNGAKKVVAFKFSNPDDVSLGDIAKLTIYDEDNTEKETKSLSVTDNTEGVGDVFFVGVAGYDAGTYNYTIKLGDDVIGSGSFQVSK